MVVEYFPAHYFEPLELLVGREVGIFIIQAHDDADLDLWRRAPQLHRRIEPAWPKIYAKLLRAGPKGRWHAVCLKRT